ncbi:4-hydroxybenzoate transporter PcaK [Paraburkholderia rhynchosiae]|uniref:4-hydroxybenzoate transporter PcaK n=1 Tax=Paraburkholderia rhynchosiae TaxID=487049 RepID=A0A6J5AYT1_9BURK|nr:4-hydroxybenzoate transporter PcaK [Paraburkholderia rhynchosiae]
MKSADSVDIKAFIDARKVSPYQWLVLVLCFLIVMMDGLDTAVMGFVAPVVMHDWSVSRTAFGPVMSAAMVGLAIGALAAGPIADRIGRKKVLIASVLCFGFFSLICAFAETPLQLVALRFLTGLGLGAAMPNSTTLLSEYVPSRNRSLRFITSPVADA